MCIIEICALKLWGYDYVVIRHRQLRLQLKRYNKVAARRRAAVFGIKKEIPRAAKLGESDHSTLCSSKPPRLLDVLFLFGT